MKKSIRKIFNPSLKKIKQHKEQIKKILYSTYKEDFVFTEQEEKEGGFWGYVQLKTASPLKIN